MECVVEVDQIFMSSDRQGATFVWMKSHSPLFLSILQVFRDLVANVVHRLWIILSCIHWCRLQIIAQGTLDLLEYRLYKAEI